MEELPEIQYLHQAPDPKVPHLVRYKGWPKLLIVNATATSNDIWISEDKRNVLKVARRFHLDHCDAETKQYYQRRMEDNIEQMVREKAVYQHLGPHPDIFKSIESTEFGLVFPYLQNHDLREYLRLHPGQIPLARKQEWIRSALRGFAFVHSKDVLVADISARNVLVTDTESIVLCDFAGSTLGDLEYLSYYESRYGLRDQDGLVDPCIATEIFAIGCLMYEIIAEHRPYDELECEEAEERIQAKLFPSTDGMPYSSIIDKCWQVKYDSVQQILDEFDNDDGSSAGLSHSAVIAHCPPWHLQTVYPALRMPWA